MIRKCLFLVCQCSRQTWKKSTIISTGNNPIFGGFNACKTNKQQVFRLVLHSNSIDWLIRRKQNRPNLLLKRFQTRKKMKPRHKVIPKQITEAETKNLSLFTINKNTSHNLKYKNIFFNEKPFISSQLQPPKKKQIPLPFLPEKISWVSQILPPLSGSHHHLPRPKSWGKFHSTKKGRWTLEKKKVTPSCFN